MCFSFVCFIVVVHLLINKGIVSKLLCYKPYIAECSWSMVSTTPKFGEGRIIVRSILMHLSVRRIHQPSKLLFVLS